MVKKSNKKRNNWVSIELKLQKIQGEIRVYKEGEWVKFVGKIEY